MNIGDVVYLKNDPSELVVKAVATDPVTSLLTATVYAHDPNGFLIEKEFPAACLQTADPTTTEAP